MLKILHIIPRLSNAGPTRTLLIVIKTLAKMNLGIEHSIISLDQSIHSLVALRVEKAGAKIIKTKSITDTEKEIEKADIIQIHFWNNPQLYEFLRSDLPDMRLLFWFKIFGYHPPQIITQDIVNCADYCLTSSVGSLNLPCFTSLPDDIKHNKTNFALSPADFSRIRGITPQPHDNFNVGYIGTANFTKIHPRFIQMNSQIDINKIKFIVCGGNDQDLVQLAKSLEVSHRFDFRGYVHKIKDVLARLDVFGYPLCKDTYATSEQALQEAMYAEVPPVAFAHGGIPFLVQNEVTGLIVKTESEYIEQIERLHHNPQLRQKLGKEAKKYAQENFQPEKTTKRMAEVYHQLMTQPKNSYKGLKVKAETPSELFASSLGEKGKPFWTSIKDNNVDEVKVACQNIANASNVLTFAEGGIFQYRNAYPNDSYLRLWSGLILECRGRVEQAEKEFEEALRLGCDSKTVLCRIR